MTDWRIQLEGRRPDDESGTLEVVAGQRENAVDALEGWAETIGRPGFVPDSLEWRNQAGCAIVRRVSQLRYAVRCDTFEREGSSGSGWLYAVEVPE